MWHVTSSNTALRDQMHRATTVFSGADPAMASAGTLKQIERVIDQQAAALASIDLLWFCAFMTLCLVPALALLRPRAQ